MTIFFKKIKYIFLLWWFVFSLCFVFQVNADFSLPKIYVSQLIFTVKDNKISGHFTLNNRENFYNTDLNYSIKLFKGSELATRQLIDAYTPPETLSLGPQEETIKSFTYQYPQNIFSGVYTLQVEVINSKGMLLDWEDRVVSLTGLNNFLEVIEDDSRVLSGKRKSFTLTGMNVLPEEEVAVFMRIKNPGEAKTVVPQIKIFKRQYNMSLIKEYEDSPITFAKDETKEIKLTMPRLTVPESYLAEIRFFQNNNQISGPQYFRWVVQGEGGKILYIKTDKDSYVAGENMKIFVGIVGPADASQIKKVKLEVFVYDQNRNIVGKTIKDIDAIGAEPLGITIKVPVKRAIFSPKIEAKITKEKKLLDEYKTTLPVFSKRAKEMQKRAEEEGVKRKNIFYLFLTIISIIILLILIFFRKRKLFLLLFLLINLFLVFRIIDAGGYVWMYLESPPIYNAQDQIQSVCLPKGYLKIKGDITILACSNSPAFTAPVEVYVGGNHIGTIPVYMKANVDTTFEENFAIGNLANCIITGPSHIEKDSTASFVLTYAGVGSNPNFLSGYPTCGRGGELQSSSCNTNGCTFSCKYNSVGVSTVYAKIESQSKTAIAHCATSITVTSPSNSGVSCTFSNNPLTVNQGQTETTFTLTYQGMDEEMPIFLRADCGQKGAVLLSDENHPLKCQDGQCSFTCKDYSMTGSYTAFAQIGNEDFSKVAHCEKGFAVQGSLGNCTINTHKEGDEVFFTVTKPSGMGNPSFAKGYPVCGERGSLITSSPPPCDSNSCSFYCRYPFSGIYNDTVFVKIKSDDQLAGCSANVEINNENNLLNFIPESTYTVKASNITVFSVKGGGGGFIDYGEGSNDVFISECECPTGYLSKDGVCVKSSFDLNYQPRCEIFGPQGTILVNTTPTFTLKYYNMSEPVDFVNSNDVCGNGSQATNVSCSDGECTFNCSYSKSGQYNVTGVVQDNLNSVTCQTSISVEDTGSCTLIGPSAPIEIGGTATFTLTYSNMGSGTPSFISGYPICGDKAKLSSSSCNNSICTFTCKEYERGSYTVSAGIKGSNNTTAYCNTSIRVKGAPEVANMKIIPDYCSNYLTFSWEYRGDSPEEKYEIQISDNSAFSSLKLNKAVQVNGNGCSLTGDNYYKCTNSYSVRVGSSGELDYNSSYYWKARVYDGTSWSSWYYWTPDGGTTSINDAESFSTLDHAAPNPSFSVPSVVSLVNNTARVDFINQSQCFASNPNNCLFSWDFDDQFCSPLPSCNTSDEKENVSHVYTRANIYSPRLTICDEELEVDNKTICCSTEKSLQVRSLPNVPEWKEISPFQ